MKVDGAVYEDQPAHLFSLKSKKSKYVFGPVLTFQNSPRAESNTFAAQKLFFSFTYIVK